MADELKELIGLLIALIAVMGGLGLPFFVIYYQNQERRALIEKGMDPNLVFSWLKPGKERKHTASPHGPLLWGSLLTGVGLGILTGYFVSYFTGLQSTIITDGTAVLFGGLA